MVTKYGREECYCKRALVSGYSKVECYFECSLLLSTVKKSLTLSVLWLLNTV